MASKRFDYNKINYNISYKLLNTSQKESILILHGWGANKELMESCFKDSFKDFCHIYVDLPGFGNSSLQEPLDSFEVKDIVEKFLNEIKLNPKIIIGHSFGGKIATLLNPQILILLSSAGIVLPKRFTIRFKIGLFKILKKIGFGRFYRFFASNDVKNMNQTTYEMFKKVVNEDMSENFQKFKNIALIFWGKDDKATPVRAGEKIHSLIKNSKFFVCEGDHFFFINKADFIEKTFTCKE